MGITLPLNLNGFSVSQKENDKGLTTISPDGLALTTGIYNDGLGVSSLAPAALTKVLGGLADGTQNNLTTAELDNIHLVTGQTLTITFNYAFQNVHKDFYAFAILGTGSNFSVDALVDNKQVAANNYTNDTSYSNSFKINTTGNYNLFIGNASAGNNPSTDTLTIHSVTITAPDGSYTTTPVGIRLNADGSQLLSSGDGRLADGTVLANYLTEGSSRLLAVNTDLDAIISHDGGGIISHDGGGIISHDGGGIISHDGGGIISHDGGGLISNDGAGLSNAGLTSLIASGSLNGLVPALGTTLVAAGGGNLVAAGGGNLVAAGGGNLVAAGGGNIATADAALISNDGGGLISNDGGGIFVRTTALKSVNVAASPVLTLAAVTPIGGDTAIGVSATGQQNDPQVADLGNGNFVTVWSDSSPGHFTIRGQVSSDVDASNVGSFFNITSGAADQTHPSVAKLASGGFVVAWLGSESELFAVHTQVFDASGTKIGAEQTLSDVLLNNALRSHLQVVATPDGGFSTVFELAAQGGGAPTYIIGQRYGKDGTPDVSFAVGDLGNGGIKSDTAAVALKDGSIAVAYRDVTTSAGTLDTKEHDGVFLDIIGKDGTATKSEVQVDTSISGTQRSPSVAQLANGNIVVAWVDVGTSSGTGLATVRAQVISENGTKVGGEYKIADTLTDSNAPPVSVTALKDGTFSVVWTAPVLDSSKAIVGSNLQGRIFTADGTGDGPIFNVNTPSGDNSSRDAAPAQTQLLNGSLLVAGSVTHGTDSTIKANLIDVGATHDLPPPTSGTGSPPPAPPAVFTPTKIGVEFAAGSGPLIALKNGNFATVQDTHLQIYNPQGFTVGPAVTVASNSDGSLVDLGGRNPVATVLTDGRIAVAYTATSDYSIRGEIFNADGSVSVPTFTIKSESGTSWFVNGIIALSNGRFALNEGSYNGSVGGRDGLLQVVDGTGTTTIPSFQAFTDFSGNGASINMAVLADGRLALVGRTSSGPEVAQIYSSDFTSHTTETLALNVNYSYAFGDTTQTAVLDNGNIVHLFRPNANLTGFDSVGVRGQIFQADGTPVGAQFVLPGENANPNQSQVGETVVALPGGGFVVAFSGNDGPTTGNSGSSRAVELQRYNDDGTTNGSLVVTSVDRGQNTDGHPKLLVLGDGNLALSFTVGPELAQIYSLSAGTPAALTPATFSKVSPDAHADFAPIAIAAGHFIAGDSNVDIVTANANTSTDNANDFTVLRSDGHGVLTPVGASVFAPNPADIKVADFNNDGHPDIVVARNTQGYPQVFLGKGDGTFDAQTAITKTKPGDGMLAVADLDGDGNVDIVTANGDATYGEQTISVLRGDGTGHFTETDYVAALPPGYGTASINGVAVGDLNGDGRPDILGRTSAGVVAFLAQADGSYAAGATKLVSNNLNAAVLADVNGDGKLDIVETNNVGAQILLGFGDGTFSDPQTIQTGTYGPSGIQTAGVAVGDLNGDGKVDVVVANNRNNTISILLGNGDGTFVQQDAIAVGNAPTAITLVDMDGDGKPDIVVTNAGDASVSVLLNTTALPATKIVQAAGAPLLVTPPVTDANGHTVSSYIDGFGNTVALTTDGAGHLLTESVTASSGQVIGLQTFTYNTDGTSTQHVDQTTDTGFLATDIAFGPAGQLTETFKDAAGNITGDAVVTYNSDGSILRHSTVTGVPGFTDETYKDGQLILSVHDDGSGSSGTGGSTGTGGSPGTGGSTDTGGSTGTGSTGTGSTGTGSTGTGSTGTSGGSVTHDAHSIEGEVYALYDGLFDRTPDAGGDQTWIDALSHGTSIHDVAQAFLASAEGQQRFGGLDNAGFVQELYETALHRSGSTTEAKGWVDALSAGASRADVAVGFALSAENIASIQSALDAGIPTTTSSAGAPVDSSISSEAGRLYFGVLGRAPDSGGLTAVTAALNAGVSEKSVAQIFLDSAEYKMNFGGLSDADYVGKLYQNALGRPVEDGYHGWTDDLAHGASRADVAIGIIESAEAHAHLQPLIDAAWHLV